MSTGNSEPRMSHYWFAPEVRRKESPQSDSEGMAKCVFYRHQPDSEGIHRPLTDLILDSCDEVDSNFVCLTQVPPDLTRIFKPDRDHEFDSDHYLFAAVAKTHEADLGLINLVRADARGRVVIPVQADHPRGLILIFARRVAGAVKLTLIATADPEIVNSSGG